QPAAHRIRGAAEKQLDLEVVESGAGVPEVAVGLVVEVARVVVRVASRGCLLRQLAEVAAAYASARTRQIGEQARNRLRVLAPGKRLDQGAWVVPRLRVAEVLVEELLQPAAQRGRRLGRGSVFPAEQGPRVGEIRE